MAKGWFRDLVIPMKPTESKPPATMTTSREWVISFRETFFIPLLRLYLFFFLLFCLDYFLPFDLREVVWSGYFCYMVLPVFDAMFPTAVPTLKKLVIYVKNRGEPLKRERITESIVSRDDAETPSLAFLAPIFIHAGILRLLLSLPSPRPYITSFDPLLFVLDGLLFSYYCLIGLSLHLSVQILEKIMKPILKTLAISLENKGIISVPSKFESGKNREQRPLVDFDSTNNRACQSGLLVSNSDKTNGREASKGPCMTEEGSLNLVDPTTRIASTDCDAPENGARLVRANQSGPITLNSEEKDTSEGLIGECLTESVLSLDDSTKQKSFPVFDATEIKAHLVSTYQSGPVVSLSENKNEGEALKRECITNSILGLEDLQQHCGGRPDAAAKSFRAIYDPGLHTTDSLARKSFEVLETLRPREQQSNATDTDQERQIQTQMCHELSDARGAHPTHLDTYIARFWTHLCPSLCHSVCIRSIFREQSNDLVPLLSLRRMMLKGCVRQDKSPCILRLLQINAVEQGLTQLPRYSGGLTAQSASSSCWPISLQDGAHIVLLDPLKQSAKNIPHAARQNQCSLTVSLREKKMARRTLKRNYRTISVIFEYHQQHIGRRCKGTAKSFGATCHCRKHGIRRVSTVKHIHKRHWIHRWPFRQKRATRNGYSLRDERPFGASNLSMDEKLDSRLLFIHMSQFARSSPQPLGLLDGGEIVGPIALSSSEFAATNNRARFVRQDQSGSTSSCREGKSARETLDRQGITMSLCIVDDLQQHFGCKHKDAMKRLGVNISMFKSTCRLHQFYWRPCWNEKNEQVFDARNNRAHLAKADQSGPTKLNSETENTRVPLKRECVTSRVLSLENLRQHCGGRHKDVAKGLGYSLAWKPFEERHELWFHTPDSLARKSFKVRDVLPLLEQSNSIRHLVPRRKLALKCWVRLKKSQDLPQTLQMKSSGGLTAQSASSLHWPINLTDGGHTASVPEKKILTIKTFKRKRRTMSVSFEDHNRHCGSRCKGAANSLGAKRMEPIWYTVKSVRRQHAIHRCPFRRGYSLGGERAAEVISFSMEEKLVSRLKFLSVYGVRRLCRLALPSGSESVGHIAFSSSEFAATNNRAWGGQDQCGSSASRHDKERTRETPNWEGIASHVITFEHLQQRFGSKREDVAKSLGMLRPPDPHGEKNPLPTFKTLSTIEQITVDNEMGCQNPKPNEFQPDSFEDLNFRNTEIGSIAEMLSDWDFLALEEEPSLEGHVSGSVNLTVAACSDPAPCQHPMPTIPDTMTTIHMMPHLSAKGDTRFVTLKVTYGKKIIKFQFPLMSGIIELKEEVKKRLKLELDSFDIEYKDEDGDCIFLGCDEDLRNHLQLFSNQVIRLLVVDSDANTANFR